MFKNILYYGTPLQKTRKYTETSTRTSVIQPSFESVPLEHKSESSRTSYDLLDATTLYVVCMQFIFSYRM
jgi:hypothetical protein